MKSNTAAYLALSILGKYHVKQLHQDDGGEEGRARRRQETISPNTTGQTSQDQEPAKRYPKPRRLGREQQCEEQSVLARPFNGHESDCSVG